MSILVTQSWLIVGRSLAAARESRVLARINVAHGATQIQPISALLASEAAKYIRSGFKQGCIICAILPSGMGARGVSSEHVENMEMFYCSPT